MTSEIKGYLLRRKSAWWGVVDKWCFFYPCGKITPLNSHDCTSVAFILCFLCRNVCACLHHRRCAPPTYDVTQFTSLRFKSLAGIKASSDVGADRLSHQSQSEVTAVGAKRKTSSLIWPFTVSQYSVGLLNKSERLQRGKQNTEGSF